MNTEKPENVVLFTTALPFNFLQQTTGLPFEPQTTGLSFQAQTSGLSFDSKTTRISGILPDSSSQSIIGIDELVDLISVESDNVGTTIAGTGFTTSTGIGNNTEGHNATVRTL